MARRIGKSYPCSGLRKNAERTIAKVIAYRMMYTVSFFAVQFLKSFFMEVDEVDNNFRVDIRKKNEDEEYSDDEV